MYQLSSTSRQAQTGPTRATQIAPRPAASIRTVMERMRATQGRARQFWHVFENSRVPMTMTDNNRQHVAANGPARLLFRLTEAEFLQTRIDDVTPPHKSSALHERWARLMTDGAVDGPYDVVLPDGSQLSVVYCALANALPGQHLIVFLPAAWSVDELAEHEDAEAEPLTRSLSGREKEVLSLIANGADRQEIADELTISVATVRTHVRNLLRKLGARNRAHAIALATQQGFIELPSPTSSSRSSAA